MVQLLETKSLYYKDVNLVVSKLGKLSSRRSVPIEGHRLVVSSMVAIVGPSFLRAVAKLPENIQPTIHIPRSIDVLDLLQLASDLKLKHIFVGIGTNTPEIEKKAIELGFKDVLIDTANGYAPAVIEAVRRIKNEGNFHRIIVGSVHTEIGFNALAEAGADIIRSGISSGFGCSTKECTGFTRGTFTDILALNSAKEEYNYRQIGGKKVIADGGFNDASDLVKAYLAGADYCMTGKLFIDAAESEMRITEDQRYKDVYMGNTAPLAKEKFGLKCDYVEGKTHKMPRTNVKPLQEILQGIWEGIQSAVTYSGGRDLSEAIGTGTFEIVHNGRP